MTTGTEPIQSCTDTTSRISGQADALGALLAVIDILPAVDYQATLATCSSLANDISSKLTAQKRCRMNVTMTRNQPTQPVSILPKYTTTFPNIDLQGDRAQRFMSAMSDLWDVAESMRSTSVCFPHQEINPGQMQAEGAIEAFSLLLEARLRLMTSMANSEDYLDHPVLESWEICQ